MIAQTRELTSAFNDAVRVIARVDDRDFQTVDIKISPFAGRQGMFFTSQDDTLLVNLRNQTGEVTGAFGLTWRGFFSAGSVGQRHLSQPGQHIASVDIIRFPKAADAKAAYEQFGDINKTFID